MKIAIMRNYFEKFIKSNFSGKNTIDNFEEKKQAIFALFPKVKIPTKRKTQSTSGKFQWRTIDKIKLDEFFK